MIEGTAVKTWAINVTRESYALELQMLVEESPEWRFSALHASSRKVEEFKIDEMARKIKTRAPVLWNLLGSLLSTSNRSTPDENPMEEDESSDSELWEHFGDIDLEGMIEMIKDDNQGSARKHRRAAKKEAILTVKRVVIISILMQGRNQKTNALESIIGIFLHSCRTPEKVIDLLAHMGISISVSSL
ncbi:hypothetical protein BDZ97DRAFT_1654271 [Flammula alnicola]|nr:hypothetical protein BDZ97DRAFT_1654271 [Flammula alnicola]